MGGLVGRRTAASEVWLPPGAVPTGVRPPFSFWPCPKRECAAPGGREKGAWARSGAVALRAYGGRRIGASADFALPSGTLGSSAIFVTAVPWRMVRRASGWSSHCLCVYFRCRWPVVDGSRGSGPMRASAPTGMRKAFCPVWYKPLQLPGQRVAKRNARKKELVKCVLAPRFSSAPAPRESAIKPVPHPAAPVGQSPQTRRHHLTPTPVQRGGAQAPKRD